MQVIKGEKFVYFDVDDTLVMWGYLGDKETRLEFVEPWGGSVWLNPNELAIKALKDHKKCGSTIIVWSQGGWDWAESVVKTLKLEEFVDAVMTKPHVWYDDVPAERIFTDRIDIGAEYHKRKKNER